MSTFLFYNPNSNPSRYSEKARFSKQESVLLAQHNSTSNTELQPQISHKPDSSVYHAQSSVCDNFDLQPAEPAQSTAALGKGFTPSQDDDTFTQHDISDVESLYSLFYGTDPSLEVGELIPHSPPQDTLSVSFDNEMVPQEVTCIPQTDSCHDRQGFVCSTNQSPEASASPPDLTAYCLNLSPSPILHARCYGSADDHATTHRSDLVRAFGVYDPDNSVESVSPRGTDMQCTNFHSDGMQVDAGNEPTSNKQCNVRLAPDVHQQPEIASLELTEKSSLETCHSNDYNSPIAQANYSIHGPKVRPEACPMTLVEEARPCDPTSSLQLYSDKEIEDSAPITDGQSESNQEPPTVHIETCSGIDEQERASLEPSIPQEAIIDATSVIADASFASNKPTPALPSSRIPDQQCYRKTFAEFSHVEIPSRPLADANRPSDKNTSVIDQPDKCCNPPLTNGPWRFDGKTLSIDIRDAEQIPTLIGYSTFRIFDGMLTQSLTFFQELARDQQIKKPANRAGKLEPSTSARRPLSSEEKQRLVQLRQQGYTWDEITSRFPGRNRRTLQAVYSRSQKDVRSLSSRHNQHPRYSPSAPRLSSDERKLGEVADARNKAGRTNQIKKSRYNLRARNNRE
ncbi:hypothetical protein BDW69DRAFT_126120 [Aspergillus filifer]